MPDFLDFLWGMPYGGGMENEHEHLNENTSAYSLGVAEASGWALNDKKNALKAWWLNLRARLMIHHNEELGDDQKDWSFRLAETRDNFLASFEQGYQPDPNGAMA